jgi:hypothetical protein
MISQVAVAYQPCTNGGSHDSGLPSKFRRQLICRPLGRAELHESINPPEAQDISGNSYSSLGHAELQELEAQRASAALSQGS